MNLSDSSTLSAKLSATPLHGGCHGTRDQAERHRGRSTRRASIPDRLGRCLPQLPDHLDVRRWRYHRRDRQTVGLHHIHGQSHPPHVPPGRDRCAAAHQASGTSQPRDARVHCGHEAGDRDQPHDPGVRILQLVGDPSGRPSGEGHRHPLQRRPTAETPPSRGLFGPSSQAHHEGQARRGRLREGQGEVAAAKKSR